MDLVLRFLRHATAADLLKKITLSKQIQLSMDGPNVNWKFLSDMKKEKEEAGSYNLVNIGSCNLHVVHEPLKSTKEATKWNLKAIMKGSFQIFKDSPARREDFISITVSTIFPLQFCPTRFEYFSFTIS